MMSKLEMRGVITGVAAVVSTFLATVLPGAPVAAQEGVFMKDLLGSVGIIPKDRPPIEYRERPPLVLPPRMELREPVNAASVETRSPQWPKDPDVLEARRKEADARVPVTETERRRMLDNNPRLTIDEIRAGRRPGAGVPDKPIYRHGDNSRDEYWIHPDQLRRMGRTEEEPVLAAGVEPERRDLSEPPSGFRKPAKTLPKRVDFEPVVREDEADPKAYIREQQLRRN